jgi:hypothetical protein
MLFRKKRITALIILNFNCRKNRNAIKKLKIQVIICTVRLPKILTALQTTEGVLGGSSTPLFQHITLILTIFYDGNSNKFCNKTTGFTSKFTKKISFYRHCSAVSLLFYWNTELFRYIDFIIIAFLIMQPPPKISGYAIGVKNLFIILFLKWGSMYLSWMEYVWDECYV